MFGPPGPQRKKKWQESVPNLGSRKKNSGYPYVWTCMGVLSFLPSGTYLSASIRPKNCPSGQENETSEIIKIKVVWGGYLSREECRYEYNWLSRIVKVGKSTYFLSWENCQSNAQIIIDLVTSTYLIGNGKRKRSRLE